MRGRKAADDTSAWAESVWPHIHEARAAGAFTLQEIADALNKRGVPAFKGGRWVSMQVWRLVRHSSGHDQPTRLEPGRGPAPR